MTRTSTAAGGLAALGFALTYWLADISLNRFAFGDGWTILWPLNGITIALLLQRPRSTWWSVLLGVEVGTGIAECMCGNPPELEIGLRACSALEVLICALALPQYTDLQEWFRIPRIHARFTAALAAGPGISGIVVALFFHDALGQSRLWAFNSWATADALGIAATMPLVLSLRSRQMRSVLSQAALWKAVSLLLITFGISALIFSVSRYPLLFLLYPLLVWIDSVLSFAGSAIAAAGVCFIAVFCTVRGLGPFGTWPATLELPRDLALQLFIGFHLVTRFPVSVMLMERRRLAQEGERLAEDLRRSNDRLITLATLDGLTGVANRRAFDERFHAEWQRAINGNDSVALVLIDVDHFKQFNDLYGHAKGDECLKLVAGALQVEARRSDNLVARFSLENLRLVNEHFGDTTKIRLRRLLRTDGNAVRLIE